MKKILIPIALVLAMILGFSGAQADLLTNGSFENGTNPPPSSPKENSYRELTAVNGDIAGWSVTSGSIDWVYYLWPAKSGTKSIDLNGTTAGTIETTFNTTPGQTYEVTFWLSGNFLAGDLDEKSVLVSADNQSKKFDIVRTSGWSWSNMGWALQSWCFTADGASATLVFQSLETDGTGSYLWGGPALDGVSVNAVPLPPSALLLGSGLLGLAGFRRFRKG